MKITKAVSHLFFASILTLLAHQATALTPNYQSSYQDWWWNPAQSGMGINIGQSNNVLVVTWYHFDGEGKAAYLMLSGPLEGNRLSGILYRTTGPAPGPGYDRTSVHSTEAGTATIEFHSPGNATLTYQYDEKSGSITLQRFLYAPPLSDKNTIMLSGKQEHTGCEEGWPRNLGNSVFYGTWNLLQTTVHLQKTGNNTYDLSFSLFNENYGNIIESRYSKKDIVSFWCTAKDIGLTTESGMYTGTANVTCQAAALIHPYDDGNDITIGTPRPPQESPPPQPEFISLNRDATLTVKHLKVDTHNSIFDFTLDFNNTTAKTCERYVKHFNTGNKPHGYYWRTEGERIALIQACENYPTPEPDEGIKTVTLPSTCTVSGYTEGVSVAITP